MVEAAIVFPFVILVVLVIVTITIWLYEEEVSMVALHINLWNQAQIESATGEDNKALNTYSQVIPMEMRFFIWKKNPMLSWVFLL